MVSQSFPSRSLLRTVMTAVQLAGLGIALAGFSVGAVAQNAPIANAATVPDAPTMPAAAVLRTPLPPSASQEIIEERPSSQHLWIGGHWRWQDGNYVWIASHWELPPRANVTWVEPRWEQKSGGYVLASGYWQEAAGSASAAPAPVILPGPPPGMVSAPPAPQGQEIYVMEAPPPPIREVIVERPSQRHVWVAGYWAWRGGRHVWVGGHWELPPRERVTWVDPHWERRSNGYVFVQGFWHDIGGSGVSLGVSIGSPPPREVVVIRDAPPPPRREYVDERRRPSPRHVWVSGYWRYDGRGYDWVSGHWDLPPRPRATWVEPRWERRGGTYVFIEGSWR